ncbi:hypothetical protein FXF65_36430 [Actinomadura syzygii]|uniref:VOC domain-containing protein n=1 Tax=Actinomadura syzygii TaxID=1427538 RepID=A0A5D0TTE5_9ACTN|nr:hypothetical protein FXF65_36430 [Actinomadura syzygii]
MLGPGERIRQGRARRGSGTLFEIGRFYHAIHMVSDLDAADDWYDRVFGVERFYKGHLAVEKRDASLVVIADFVMEPMMSSQLPGAEATPVGRFYARFGQHLHSLAWYVTDLRGLYERLRSAGVRVTGPGGGGMESGEFPGSLYTHPRDSHGAIEFVDADAVSGLVDPRFRPGFSTRFWSDEHPLGVERVSHLTVVVRDLEPAVAFYAGTLGGEVLRRGRGTDGADSAFVHVGADTVIELARPDGENGPAGRDLARNGEILHSVTFEVRSLDAARKHLSACGVRIADETSGELLLEPDDCFGAVLRLTEDAAGS